MSLYRINLTMIYELYSFLSIGSSKHIFLYTILVRKFDRKFLSATCEIIESISWFALGGYCYQVENDPTQQLPSLITYMASAGVVIAPLLVFPPGKIYWN